MHDVNCKVQIVVRVDLQIIAHHQTLTSSRARMTVRNVNRAVGLTHGIFVIVMQITWLTTNRAR